MSDNMSSTLWQLQHMITTSHTHTHTHSLTHVQHTRCLHSVPAHLPEHSRQELPCPPDAGQSGHTESAPVSRSIRSRVQFWDEVPGGGLRGRDC